MAFVDLWPRIGKTGRIALMVVLICVLVGVDRMTKMVIPRWAADVDPEFANSVITITDHRNFGIIANIALPKMLIFAITIFVIAFVIREWIRAFDQQRFAVAFFLSFIIAGALGNLWDRLQFGYVIDWLLLFQRSIINFADIWIGFGLLGYVICVFRQSEKKDDASEIAR